MPRYVSSTKIRISLTIYEGVAFANVTGILYPMVGFGEREAQILINFGESPFVYNVASHDWGTDRYSPGGGIWKPLRHGYTVSSPTTELASLSL